MKILDVLNEQIDTKVTDHTTGLNLKVPHLDRRERERVLGRGIANVVLKNKRDPHTVLRHNSNLENTSQDSSNVYYQWLVDTRAYNDNPYFPRIYDKTIISDKTGKKLIKHEIEKLKSIESLPIETIRGLTRNLFDDKAINQILRHTAGRQSWQEMDDYERALIILLNGIEEVFHGSLSSQDDNLNAALKTANELSHKNFFSGSDLHRGNVMVRLTPHGPQLVLTDPI